MASDPHGAVLEPDLGDSSSSDDSDDDDLMAENVDVDVLADADDDDDDEDLNSVSPSTSSPAAVPIAVPSASAVTVAVPNGVNPPIPACTDSAPLETTLVIHQPEEKRPPPPSFHVPVTVTLPPPQHHQIDDSRRLFQRLWTDEDEIELLQGFLEYTTQRGVNHHDTALFYDQIKSKLQLEFNKNQLVEKLRRLKKKYRNVLAKISSGKDFNFKSPHDQATFEISRKIWSSTGKLCGEDGNFDDDDGNPNSNPNFHNFIETEVKIEDPKSTPKSRKRQRPKSSAGVATAVKLDDKRLLNETPVPVADINNNINVNAVHNSTPNVSGLIEETIKSCLSPLLKELLNNAVASGSSNSRGIGGLANLAMNSMPLSFGGGEMMADDKWRKQQIMELEVYSKRLELVQDQIRAQLEELRSMDR